MYKQIIIARKDLNMSPGKLAAQVSHASSAFLCMLVKGGAHKKGDDYDINFKLEKDIFEQWMNGAFTKVVLQAKNKSQLLKAVSIAEELGMVPGKEYFIIKDNCYTELEPEEIGDDGIGRTITCVGFKPMDSEVIDQIAKKYHLWT